MSADNGEPGGSDPSESFAQGTDDDEPRITFYGGRGMSAFPIAFFILWAIAQTALWRISDGENPNRYCCP